MGSLQDGLTDTERARSVRGFWYRLTGPLRAVAKRWGPTSLRRFVWEREFQRERWFTVEELERPAINDHVEEYCRRGAILDLGCADGIVGLTLNPERYESYVGVDISQIAVDKASAHYRARGNELEKNTYVRADIEDYQPDRKFQVVLFRHSLYYFNRINVGKVLDHYRQWLADDGVIIVVMGQPQRHRWLVELIRERFEVLSDEAHGYATVQVFR